MTYCLNPDCYKPQNPANANFCLNCGTKLLLRQRYQAISQLGEGGFGKTYRAVDKDRLNEVCVIKQFSPSPEIQGNSQALNKAIELFNQEAIRLYELGKHDRIPNLQAYFEQDKRLYLVQELVDGENLLNELESHGTFNESQIWQLLADLLPVVKFIHEHGVIHRDIKPENIMRRQSDRALVLIDFGVSKQASGTIISGARGTMAGTPGYAPDEQMRFGEAYPASDLYSLGATCLHLMTGMHPSNLYNAWESRWLWQEQLSSADITISNQLVAILDKLLKDRVGDRYQSVQQVLQDINSSNSPAEVPPTIITKPPKTAPRIPGWRCIHTLTGHAASVRSIAISPDGQTIASGSDDNTIKLWHLDNGNLKSTLTLPSGLLKRETTWYTSIVFSRDGQTIISGCLDKSIKVWDWSSGKQLRKLKGHSDRVNAIALSPDGQTLVSGSRDNIVKVWNLPTGQLIRNLTGHSNSVHTLAISPDGQILASGSWDNTIKVWNLLNGKLIRTFTGHLDWVYSVAISPDSQTLVSGSRDKTIHLWHLESGTMIRSLAGHSDWVSAVAVSPQNNLLVSGSRDKTIKLWDMGNGQLIETLTGHLDLIHAIAFSPDGRSIISSSNDGAIKIWRY
ncbi:protein kinase [Nostocaceae cyanobacterium CENA369]|uniref:Protein kinase n=1 Tax=Dendronalium phyllosphericum CENA369 TaxID=1725256 RepID=A0A8J7LCG2_9NOST|nr:serine/threonine-protein kinase [Dendronalium phyllosphericum]MBH8572812.1 protein kinase [Dendronalium phyllosphericum CENA369]